MKKSELKKVINNLVPVSKETGLLAYLYNCKIQDVTIRQFKLGKKNHFKAIHSELLNRDKSVFKMARDPSFNEINREDSLIEHLRDLESFQIIGKQFFDRDYFKFDVPPRNTPSHKMAWFFLEITKELESLHRLFVRNHKKMLVTDRLGPQIPLKPSKNSSNLYLYSINENLWGLENEKRKLIKKLSNDEAFLVRAIVSACYEDSFLQLMPLPHNYFACARYKSVRAELSKILLKKSDPPKTIYERVIKAQLKLKNPWLKSIQDKNLVPNKNESILCLEFSGTVS